MNETGVQRIGQSVLLPYDCTRSSEHALLCAVAYCRESRARLGIAITPPWFMSFASPWVTVPPNMVLPCHATAREMLSRVPPDAPFTFLISHYPAGVPQIAEFARRLDCDSVLLPLGGWRLRRATRALGKLGLPVLNDQVDPIRPSRPTRRGTSRTPRDLAGQLSSEVT
jgi:hypothetical protein